MMLSVPPTLTVPFEGRCTISAFSIGPEELKNLILHGLPLVVVMWPLTV